jgi:hypothetical protein
VLPSAFHQATDLKTLADGKDRQRQLGNPGSLRGVQQQYNRLIECLVNVPPCFHEGSIASTPVKVCKFVKLDLARVTCTLTK